jgi:type VI secretion system protein ImpK
MTSINHQRSGIAAINIDLIFQDTYLLAVELRHGRTMTDSTTLRQTCIAQVEGARSALQEAGMSPRSIDLIIHAQCALLDEAVLANVGDRVRDLWITESLQARFCGHHRAGEILHEQMREVLREPAPDMHVVTLFQRVMMLGFLGGYRSLDDEERLVLKNRLDALAGPHLFPVRPTWIDARGPVRRFPWWLRSPLLHLAIAGLALFALWWFLNRTLANMVDELVVRGV